MGKATLWIILVLVLAALLIDIPYGGKITVPKTPISFSLPSSHFPIKLGLDLQGGTELILQTQMDKISPADRDSALESSKEVIERRVNPTGVSEVLVQTSKVGEDRRILVSLPGVTDASAAAALVGKTAKLDFREEPASYSAQELEATRSGLPLILFYKSTGLGGIDLRKAAVVFNQSGSSNGGPEVSLEFSDSGTKKFADITRRNVGKPLAIFLDDVPIEAPTVQTEILDGHAVINGSFTTDSANTLVKQLNAGALPVPIKVLSQRSISATLGSESVKKSLAAGVIGLSIVILFMIAYYGLLGVVASGALLIYSLLVLAIFKTGLFIPQLQVTLTLAGVAGFILSIGMAVDANILIFERMKEEKRWGKGKKQIIELGFQRAWSSIRDSNISSLMTAAILYKTDIKLVQSFAVTLAIGVLVSMFTATVVTKTLLKYFQKYVI